MYVSIIMHYCNMKYKIDKENIRNETLFLRRTIVNVKNMLYDKNGMLVLNILF